MVIMVSVWFGHAVKSTGGACGDCSLMETGRENELLFRGFFIGNCDFPTSTNWLYSSDSFQTKRGIFVVVHCISQNLNLWRHTWISVHKNSGFFF